VSSFVIIAFIVGAIVTVFYAEQLGTEVAVGVAINGVQPFEALPWRGLGRYLTFLVFDVAFAFAVAMSVWRGYKTGS
jgi:p-aminobenzoyl-glutamate transporter AbgT